MTTLHSKKDVCWKVCVITFPLGGPGQANLMNFIKIFESLPVELYIITGNFHRDISGKKNHIKNIDYNSKNELTLLKVIKYILIEIKISYNLIKKHRNIDIIFFFLGASQALLPMLCAKLLGKKAVIIDTGLASKAMEICCRGMLFGYGSTIFSHIAGTLEEINYKLSDKIVLYSDSLIKQLELDKYKNKILTIGARFVDTNLFQVQKKIQNREKVIGYIGRLSQEKGIINFIDAIPQIKEENKDNKMSFIIVGGGELLNKVEEAVRETGVQDKVTIIGEVPSSIVPNYLNELKLLVIPSYNEAGPQIVIEAMACETPILSTPVGWVPDLIEDGKTGFILADNSPECIAKNVIRVLKQQNLEDIVQNGHDLITQGYTRKAAAQRYRAIIQGVLSDNKTEDLKEDRKNENTFL